jgi:hypothetical protein
LAGEPVVVDVTESSSLIWAADNRDFRLNQVPTLTNDHWGVWYNRLNVQASSAAWQLGLRLDNAWFYSSPDPTAVALELERERRAARGGGPDPSYFRNKVFEAGGELSNRYINWLYPAKYYASYTSRRLELTVGDSYAELGRGFVLSVRKQDELASDNTVRGLRATARLHSGELKLKLTGLGGSLNPLRLDEASGRYLGSDDSVTPGWLALTEAGMPRAVETDFAPDGGDCTRFATCSFAPDRILAAQLEARTSGLVLATQASVLERQTPLSTDAVRSAGRIITGSQSVELPRLSRELSLYFEAALQKLDEQPESAIDAGHALYTSLSYGAGPLHLTLEGKHYRRFFPLRANVSAARAREFSDLAYSAPPTTEPLTADTMFENFNTCTSGARLSAGAGASQTLTLIGSFAHYRSWAESVANEACVIADRFENRIFDGEAGFELDPEASGLHARLTLGGRLDHAAEPRPTPSGADSELYYHELNTRHELTLELGGPFELELTGTHRRRFQLVGGPTDVWFEGRQVASLNIGPRWSAAVGFEYDTSGLVPATYVNTEARFRPTPATSLALFVGQRAGALRCVGGVCRVFPPFEGGRLDAVVRF